ncbi:hypothetical protein SUDANB120_00270 [Streptomyces sp. enrichment culture]
MASARSGPMSTHVHAAGRELTAEVGRDALTVLLIAPSTVCRCWGGLQELLSDVAVERLRGLTPPRATTARRPPT